MSWDGNILDKIEEITVGDMGDSTGIIVNNTLISVEPGTKMVDTIVNTAMEAGFGKFNVQLNGESIDPEQAPEFFNEGDQVRILKYEEAGK